jgi:hypothetical protein
MSKLNEHTDYLPAFSDPAYDIDKRYNAVFLGKDKEISYFDEKCVGSTLLCPLFKDLTEKDINEFKAYVYKAHHVEHIVTVDGGARGKGMFCIFKRGNK